MPSVRPLIFDETYVETLKQFPSPVVLVDQKGVIRLASDAAHETFGYEIGKLIDLSVENLGDSLKLSVSDRGPGLPEANVEGLFEMFHRADNEETRRIPGTGIGLHVSKRIIDEHGGIIELKEREGGGAVASFTIPVDL